MQNNMSEVDALLSQGKKIRRHSWWWGRYIVKNKKGIVVFADGTPCEGSQIPMSLNNGEWEEYNESDHGLHNEK